MKQEYIPIILELRISSPIVTYLEKIILNQEKEGCLLRIKKGRSNE
jgi:hypothetical protein